MDRRVLIVDDEEDIREVARLSMEMMGDWQVRCARSGREGVDLARRERPDVILLDVMMPDLDGPATVRMLQEDPVTREVPVILLTAKVQASERRQFADLGVLGVIAKPFDPMTLADQVAEMLAGR